jgi:N-acetylglucosamine kinase-like BadF-type ATPase
VFDDVSWLSAMVGRALECPRVVVAADAVTAHLGALRGQSGAVVVAGTGVVALGTDYVDHWNRVDGWGHLLGDDGGGAWIGMLGLRAAFRSLDGRPGGSPELCALAAERFGPLRELGMQLYTSADRAGRLASFAPDVIQAAAQNEPIASDIVDSAGEHLATAAATAAHNVAPRVACSGGIFDASEAINASFGHHMAHVAPGVEVVPTLGTPLDGATALARLAASRPRQVPHHDQFITMLGEPV